MQFIALALILYAVAPANCQDVSFDATGEVITMDYSQGVHLWHFIKLASDVLGEPLHVWVAEAPGAKTDPDKSVLRGASESVEIREFRSYMTRKLAEVDFVAIPVGPLVSVSHESLAADLQPIACAPCVPVLELWNEPQGSEFCTTAIHLRRNRADKVVELHGSAFGAGGNSWDRLESFEPSDAVVMTGSLHVLQSVAAQILEAEGKRVPDPRSPSR